VNETPLFQPFRREGLLREDDASASLISRMITSSPAGVVGLTSLSTAQPSCSPRQSAGPRPTGSAGPIR